MLRKEFLCGVGLVVGNGNLVPEHEFALQELLLERRRVARALGHASLGRTPQNP